MSMDNPGQATQQVSGDKAGTEVAAFFNSIPSDYQPRLRDLRGVCRFDVAGAGTWSFVVKEGQVAVIAGAEKAPPEDCVVSGTAEDALRIIHSDNHMNLLTAALQGLVTLSGDGVFGLEFLGGFIVERAGVTQQ